MENKTELNKQSRILNCVGEMITTIFFCLSSVYLRSRKSCQDFYFFLFLNTDDWRGGRLETLELRRLTCNRQMKRVRAPPSQVQRVTQAKCRKSDLDSLASVPPIHTAQGSSPTTKYFSLQSPNHKLSQVTLLSGDWLQCGRNPRPGVGLLWTCWCLTAGAQDYFVVNSIENNSNSRDSKYFV